MWTGTVVVSIILLIMAVDCNFLWLFGRSPGFSDIMHPVVSEASEVYSADGVLMGKYFNENRTPVTYDELNPKLVLTLISTEDERFYDHHGVDYTGLFAAVKDMVLGHARGASTITQQLAKNLFRVRTQYSTGLFGMIPGVKILVMKAKEWIVATKLEMLYSKEDILTMYFNTVDFGSNAYGIKTAAKTYFGTTPSRLNYEQAATLVGLLKATSTYNPILNPENSTERRNVVLENAYQHGAIVIDGCQANEEQLDSLKAIPMQVRGQDIESSYDGIAPYFRQALTSYIDMLCAKGLIPGYSADNRLDLYADGLKIYTTLDTKMQKYAEDAATSQMKKVQQNFNNHWGNVNPWQDAKHQEIPHFIEDIAKKTSMYAFLKAKYDDMEDSIWYAMNKPHTVKIFTYNGTQEREMSTMDSIRYMVKFMHCGFVAIEPDTREVKAWVGDIDFNSWKYDKVTAMRQAGSTFKLFVYTEAMNQGMTPNDSEVDSYVSYPDTDKDGKPTTWAPHNADGHFSGARMTYKQAFARSINSVAVKTGMKVGVHNVAVTAHKMGITTPLNETPSLSLGSSDVTLMDLVNSYCTVVDDGKYNMPILVTRIEDRDGNLLYEAKLTDEQAISHRSAVLMQSMLRAGMQGYGGTIGALWSWIQPYSRDTDFGGKTGTSNNHSDAWFVGVTPKLVAGAWVGGEYRSIHFRTGALGQGSRTALPIYGQFMRYLLGDRHYSKYACHFPKYDDVDDSATGGGDYYLDRGDSIKSDSVSSEGTDIDNSGEEPVETDIQNEAEKEEQI